MRWKIPPQQHCNMPVCNDDAPAAGPILAFAEGQVLAKSCRRRPGRLTTAFGGKADEIIE